ncbi:MAG: hypothetical protein ACYC6Y_21015 [Thermoguttaceae bacterium]
MNNKRKLYRHLAAGIVLALGPVWAYVGSILVMTVAFSEGFKNGTVNQEALMGYMSVAFYSILAGYIALPIGIILIVVTAIRLLRNARIQTALLTSPRTEPLLRAGR